MTPNLAHLTGYRRRAIISRRDRRARGWTRGTGGSVVIARLEELTSGAVVAGVVPDHHVTVVTVAWHGTEIVTLTYRAADGQVAEKLVYRTDEAGLVHRRGSD